MDIINTVYFVFFANKSVCLFEIFFFSCFQHLDQKRNILINIFLLVNLKKPHWYFQNSKILFDFSLKRYVTRTIVLSLPAAEPLDMLCSINTSAERSKRGQAGNRGFPHNKQGRAFRWAHFPPGSKFKRHLRLKNLAAVMVMCVCTYESFFFGMVNECMNTEQTLAVLQLRQKKNKKKSWRHSRAWTYFTWAWTWLKQICFICTRTAGLHH